MISHYFLGSLNLVWHRDMWLGPCSGPQAPYLHVCTNETTPYRKLNLLNTTASEKHGTFWCQHHERHKVWGSEPWFWWQLRSSTEREPGVRGGSSDIQVVVTSGAKTASGTRSHSAHITKQNKNHSHMSICNKTRSQGVVMYCAYNPSIQEVKETG